MSDNEAKAKIGVLGASGYTGAELLRLLLRHPRVNFHAEHPAPDGLERSRRDTSAGPYIEHVSARACGNDPLDESSGVARPTPVVALRVRAERLRHLPGLVSLPVRLGCRSWRYSDHMPTLNGRTPARQAPPGAAQLEPRPCRRG